MISDLVVLHDLDGAASRFQLHFLHHSKHVGLHGEGQGQAKVCDVMIQNPLLYSPIETHRLGLNSKLSGGKVFRLTFIMAD